MILWLVCEAKHYPSIERLINRTTEQSHLYKIIREVNLSYYAVSLIFQWWFKPDNTFNTSENPEYGTHGKFLEKRFNQPGLNLALRYMHLTLLCGNEYTERMYPINALLIYFVFRLSQNTTYRIRELKLSGKTSQSLFWRKKAYILRF